MRNVLITGGCGFIGSNFVHYTRANTDWSITVLDKLTYAGRIENLNALKDDSRLNIVIGDLGSCELVKHIIIAKKMHLKQIL